MERLLTVQQVAEILSVPVSWIYGRVHVRTLPFRFIKVGHYLRFRASDIREFIDK